MCILVTMRLTKNTNAATREWVDGILCQLDLVIANGSYRDILETLKAHQIANSSAAEVTESLTIYLCMTKLQADIKRGQNLNFKFLNLDLAWPVLPATVLYVATFFPSPTQRQIRAHLESESRPAMIGA